MENTSIADMTPLNSLKDAARSKVGNCPWRNDPVVAPSSKNSLKTKPESPAHWEDEGKRVISIPSPSGELDNFPRHLFEGLHLSEINSTPVSISLLLAG